MAYNPQPIHTRTVPSGTRRQDAAPLPVPTAVSSPVELSAERGPMVWVPGPDAGFICVPHDTLPPGYLHTTLAPAAPPRDLTPQPVLDPTAQRVLAGGIAAVSGSSALVVVLALLLLAKLTRRSSRCGTSVHYKWSSNRRCCRGQGRLPACRRFTGPDQTYGGSTVRSPGTTLQRTHDALEGEPFMPDLNTFISEGFGSVATAAVSLLAIPAVIIAGHIQGKNARRAGEVQAGAALEAAREQARLSYRAALDSAKEVSRENHAQWQRDRCQEVWATYVQALDLLLSKVEANGKEARSEDLLKAYAMVELLSPPSILTKAREAKDGALDFTTALKLAHEQRRRHAALTDAREELEVAVAAASTLSRDRSGELVETIQIGFDESEEYGPQSEEDFEEMQGRFKRGEAARAALQALDEAAQTPGNEAAKNRAREALVAAAFSEPAADKLSHTACEDRAAHSAMLAQKRAALEALRGEFVAEARKELDALGS
ncbi:hypothetical protein [Streptomyces sp. NPDC095602]|uniref:hypothetical protein n=1 Tax=Streptomyces sp. NPDC095602 TaxID=3155819 RepID=UPI0033201AEC